MVSRTLIALLAPAALAGCVGAASTVVHTPFAAVSVAKVPFKAGAKMVDWTTTSPSERDRAFVRRQRKAEERAARERREREKRCRHRGPAAGCQAYTSDRADD